MQVAVIGGGMAGLTAAIEAAEAGASVTLYDARSSLGGRARTHLRDGFQFNEGAHALYIGGPTMAMLKRLGLEPTGAIPDVGNGVGVDGDLIGRMPAGALTLLRTPLLKGDRLALLKLFAKLPRLNPADYATMTVRQAMQTLLGEGVAARFCEALIRLSAYGNDPTQASADAGLAQLKMGMDTGVKYLDGGWQVMVDGLLAHARAAGVMVRSQAKVSAVRLLAGEAGEPDTRVELTVDGHQETFGSVVLAAGGPRQAAGLLKDSVPAAATWAAQARPAAAACLDVGLAAPWGDNPTFVLGIDEPLYLSVHAPAANLAPEGHTLVHVMRYNTPDETPDVDGGTGPHRLACERLLDRIRPGWRDDAIHVGFRPHLLAATDQPSAARGGMAGRPPVVVADAPGIFLAGDWVGDTGVLVDASVASGQLAGRSAAASVNAHAELVR
jgi:phytoene dehydrogenase-like protein